MGKVCKFDEKVQEHLKDLRLDKKSTTQVYPKLRKLKTYKKNFKKHLIIFSYLFI